MMSEFCECPKSFFQSNVASFTEWSFLDDHAVRAQKWILSIEWSSHGALDVIGSWHVTSDL